MGATTFIHTIEATSVENAKKKLVEEAIFEKGNNAYNGTISTCSKLRKGKIFSKYDEKNENIMLDFAQKDLSNLAKREVKYIDLGVIAYNEITIKKIPQKSTAKYEQKYVVVDAFTGQMVSSKAFGNTKKVADNLAIQYLLKGRTVEVKKVPVLTSGSNLCTSFVITTKRVTKMPNATKKVVEPIHKYIFYGVAAE